MRIGRAVPLKNCSDSLDVGGVAAPSSGISSLSGRAQTSNAAPATSKNDFMVGFHIQCRLVGNLSGLRGTLSSYSQGGPPSPLAKLNLPSLSQHADAQN